MPARPKPPIDLGRALVECWQTHERLNQFLLERLEPSIWQAKPPGGKGRTIAAIASHMHNVRHMWLVVSGKGLALEIPEKVERGALTLPQARKALAASARSIQAVIEHALANGGHVRDFKPDVVGFVGYAIAHEAHHRGQICALARELGHALPPEAAFGMWDWKKRWGERG